MSDNRDVVLHNDTVIVDVNQLLPVHDNVGADEESALPSQAAVSVSSGTYNEICADNSTASTPAETSAGSPGQSPNPQDAHPKNTRQVSKRLTRRRSSVVQPVRSNILHHFLEMLCQDFRCYGECFQTDLCSGVRLIYELSYFPPQMDAEETAACEGFIASAPEESYVIGVGLPGNARAIGKPQVHSLAALLADDHFFDAGGKRLAAAGALFKSAITFPILRRGVTGLPGSQRETFLGVIVVYSKEEERLGLAMKTYLNLIESMVPQVSEVLAGRANFASSRRNRAQHNLKIIWIAMRFLMPLWVKHCHRSRQNDIDSNDSGDLSPRSPLGLFASDTPRRKSKYTKIASSQGTTWATGEPKDVWASMAKEHLDQYLAKFRGGQVNMPKGLPLSEVFTTWLATFCAVSIVLVLWDFLNVTVEVAGKDNLFVLVASFGALGVLIFGLPAAPLSQPRIVVCGHVFSLTVAIVVIFIFNSHTDYIWLQKSLTASVATAGMGALGIFHPPAAAAAVACVIAWTSSVGTINANQLLFYVVSILFAIFMFIIVAAVVNNGHPNRTYPAYW